MAEPPSLEFERETESRTRHDHPDLVSLCDQAFNHLGNGFNLLGGELKREPVKDETLRLAALAFNSLRWAREQLLTGFYGPSMASSRIAFDAWLNGIYLNYYPEKLEAWKVFALRPKPPDMRKLVIARSGLDDQQAGEWRKALDNFYVGDGSRFSGLSAFAHASAEAIDILIGADDSDQNLLRLGGAYDENLLRLSVSNFCNAAHISATLFLFLLNNSSSFVTEHEAVIEEFGDQTRKFMESQDSDL
jgi:hypothetical protein